MYQTKLIKHKVMKNLGLLLIGLITINLVNGQTPNSTDNSNISESRYFAGANKNTLDIYGKNASYINNSAYLNEPLVVSKLKKEVAVFNIKNVEGYNRKEPSTYNVTFKNGQGFISATYNHNGEIIQTQEKYYNVVLPVSLRVELSKNYPDWSFDKVTYVTSFKNDLMLESEYIVKLKKGSRTKSVNISLEETRQK